jgi:hypothetical protein
MGIVHLLILDTLPERAFVVDCNICYTGNITSKENNEFSLSLILVYWCFKQSQAIFIAE